MIALTIISVILLICVTIIVVTLITNAEEYSVWKVKDDLKALTDTVGRLTSEVASKKDLEDINASLKNIINHLAWEADILSKNKEKKDEN